MTRGDGHGYANTQDSSLSPFGGPRQCATEFTLCEANVLAMTCPELKRHFHSDNILKEL